MVKSKLVRVLDKGTEMVFMVTKFEPSDIELLNLKGWEYSPDLTVITDIGISARSSISAFKLPQFDIEDRSDKLRYNHTTHGLASKVKSMYFDEIPDEINLTGLDLRR